MGPPVRLCASPGVSPSGTQSPLSTLDLPHPPTVDPVLVPVQSLTTRVPVVPPNPGSDVPLPGDSPTKTKGVETPPTLRCACTSGSTSCTHASGPGSRGSRWTDTTWRHGTPGTRPSRRGSSTSTGRSSTARSYAIHPATGPSLCLLRLGPKYLSLCVKVGVSGPDRHPGPSQVRLGLQSFFGVRRDGGTRRRGVYGRSKKRQRVRGLPYGGRLSGKGRYVLWSI